MRRKNILHSTLPDYNKRTDFRKNTNGEYWSRKNKLQLLFFGYIFWISSKKYALCVLGEYAYEINMKCCGLPFLGYFLTKIKTIK